MLRAALLSGSEARAAFLAWRPHLDWENITRSWQRLIPLLQHNLVAQGIDDPLLDRFRGLRRYFWLRNLKQMHLATEVLGALRDSGIPALALKGMSIVACYFRDRSLRPMEDVDILVPIESVGEATEILGRLSIKPMNLQPRGVAELANHGEFAGWPFQDRHREYFDLHWSALHLDRRKKFDHELWDRSIDVDVDGRTIKVMDPVDQLIHACAHAAQDDGHSTLRAVADCATILASGKVDADRLFRRADFHRLTPVVTDMIDTLVSDVGLKSPVRVSRSISRPAQRMDLALIAAASARHRGGFRSGLARAAILRRGSDELFSRPLARSAWQVFADGRRGIVAPFSSKIYHMLRRPRHLRTMLASDLRLKFPDVAALPSVVEGRDIIVEGLAKALIKGWSIDEEPGRWTDGHEAILCWRTPEEHFGDLYLSLRRQPIALGDAPVEIEIRANNSLLGKFVFAKVDSDFPEHLLVPASIANKQRLLVVSLFIRNPVRAVDLGISDDRRRLGIMVSSARISRIDRALSKTIDKRKA